MPRIIPLIRCASLFLPLLEQPAFSRYSVNWTIKEELPVYLHFWQEFRCFPCFFFFFKKLRLSFMHCLELHSFSFLDSIPQFMQSFRIVWSTVSGKPDCATMDFNMRLFRLETRLEWQLEQHFLLDYSENTGMWQTRHKMQPYFPLWNMHLQPFRGFCGL